jgi:hypothetical protein
VVPSNKLFHISERATKKVAESCPLRLVKIRATVEKLEMLRKLIKDLGEKQHEGA